MQAFPIFLSAVVVVQNQANMLEKLLSELTETIAGLVSDYELIIIDNSSDDGSVAALRELTGNHGYPNVQVYSLTKQVDIDTASWVGLENALGDFVAVVNPLNDDINFLSKMLDKAVNGYDVVLTTNQVAPVQSIGYKSAHSIFNTLYKWFNGVDLAKEAPQYRVLSKTVVNFILQHPQPEITYRHLPATGGFSTAKLQHRFVPKHGKKKKLKGSLDRGMRLLVSSSRAPMRAVTTLSLFSAAVNLLYSIYIVAVWLLKTDVEPGWTSLSLQQSGMFFMISLVLLVFGEYMLHTASLSTNSPLYHIGQEVASMRMTRREKLNVQEAEQSHHDAGFNGVASTSDDT